MGWTQTHPTDLEVFFEAVGLEEIGEFEGADVATLSTDLPLKIGDDGAQILGRVAQAQQFIPHSFPVKGQAQALAGQLAIAMVGLADRGGIDRQARGWGGFRHIPGLRCWSERMKAEPVRPRRVHVR